MMYQGSGRYLIRIVILIALNFLIAGIREGFSQYSGLRFSGHEVPLDQRTGLNLTPKKPILVHSNFEICFELSFEPGQQSYFGYIFRAVINGQNYDLIFSPANHRLPNFHLVVGERISNISFHFPLSNLISHWTPVRFILDPEQQIMELHIKDSVYRGKLYDFHKRSELYLFFGSHRHERFSSTDLPGMNLRNIEISRNGNPDYHWPLDQASGNRVREKINGYDGLVINPIWISSLHRNWKIRDSLIFKGRISYDFLESTEELLVLNGDSISYYSLESGKLETRQYTNPCIPNTNTHIIIDNKRGLVYAYSLDLGVSAVLDEKTMNWSESISNDVLTTNWHHNSVINPADGLIYTFGGYGQLKYSSSVYRFGANGGSPAPMDTKGDFFPRYLAGLGYNPSNDNIYILGGYGSKTGQQAVNPGYYFELLSFNLANNTFSTEYEFQSVQDEFCFANSLYIDTSGQIIYGLKFSKFESNPVLQAVAIPIEQPELLEVGNTISFRFLDVNSTIDLFYSGLEQKLIAVTSYFENGQTELILHEILYPLLSNLIEDEKENIQTGIDGWIIAGIIGIISVLIIVLIHFRRQRKAPPEVTDSDAGTLTEDVSEPIEPETRPGSIYIFGGFRVIDAGGTDITSYFTPLLKELFLYIMLNSLRYYKGVSSNSLNEVFWFDKSEKSARNNRAVNIGKLRTLLEGVGECSISKDTGYWKFTFNPQKIYIDFCKYLSLTKKKHKWSRREIASLLSIIKNGPALSNINADWLDDYKSEISNEIIDHILGYIHTNGKSEEPDFLISLINSIFFFDMVNEEAMIIKCQLLSSLGKHSLAKNAYTKFVKEYNTLYQEVYPRSFISVLEDEDL